MAFEGLTEKLSSAFKKLRNKGRLTESDVKEAMREIRLALLEADVSYKVVKDFIKAVTEKAVGTEVLESLTPAQAIVKIVNQELVSLMGGGSAKITIASQPPTVVMMVGLQGAGKTTNAAKLAGLMRKQNGKRPLLAACDIYRPRRDPAAGGGRKATGHSSISNGAGKSRYHCGGCHCPCEKARKRYGVSGYCRSAACGRSPDGGTASDQAGRAAQ